jgi:hypothetical protein
MIDVGGRSFMGIPNAAVRLFDALEAVLRGSSQDVNEANRKTWATDLVIALSAFPSLPPGAKHYRKTKLQELLPSADRLDARPGVPSALAKIERIFTSSQRVLSHLRIAPSH